jgi:protein-disulfide isomerase
VKTAVSSLALLVLFASVGCSQETITTTTAPTTTKTSSAPVSSPPTAPTTTTDAPSTTQPTDIGQIAPPNASPNGDAVVIFPGVAKPEAIVVDVHSDFQCPYCQVYDFFFGKTLQSLAAKGDIELRIHPRTLIGDEMIHNDSSLRAAIGVTCADTVGKFIEYHDTVFTNQPNEGVGFTDTDLRNNFAMQAGIDGDDLTTFQTCYDNRATQEWVQTAESKSRYTGVPNHAQFVNQISATPTFLANGFYIPMHEAANEDNSVDEARVLEVIQAAATGTVQYPLPEPEPEPEPTNS